MSGALNGAMRIGGAFAVAAVLLASDAEAQMWVATDVPRRGSVEISGGALWNAGQDLVARDAMLTPNPGAGLGSLELFSVDASLEPVIGAQATVGVYLTRSIAIEGGVRFARPQLEVSLRDDYEGAPDETAVSTLTQYTFTGSLLYHFSAGSRVTPFIAAGAGHIRDVHESNELVETGTEYHGKVGVKMWFGQGRRRLGLRAEGGVSIVDGGFTFDDARRTVPTAAVSLAYLF